MPVPGFDDPALAALAPGGNLYYAADAAVAVKDPGGASPLTRAGGGGQQVDQSAPSLMFGGGEAVTPAGETVVSAAKQAGGRGHVSEITNFHGSPAPWILIGLLLAAGLLHLSAGAKGEVKL